MMTPLFGFLWLKLRTQSECSPWKESRFPLSLNLHQLQLHLQEQQRQLLQREVEYFRCRGSNHNKNLVEILLKRVDMFKGDQLVPRLEFRFGTTLRSMHEGAVETLNYWDLNEGLIHLETVGAGVDSMAIKMCYV